MNLLGHLHFRTAFPWNLLAAFGTSVVSPASRGGSGADPAGSEFMASASVGRPNTQIMTCEGKAFRLLWFLDIPCSIAGLPILDHTLHVYPAGYYNSSMGQIIWMNHEFFPYPYMA